MLEEGGQRRSTIDRTWTIGKDPSCDLPVDRSTVSKVHCRLSRTRAGFEIEDLRSSNGTFVNGERISGITKVSPLDRITLGRTVDMPWPPDVGFVSGAVRIGRNSDNDVVLDFPMVSAYHARLFTREGQLWIEDLESANGTAIGAPERKVARAPLRLDDYVYFGSLRLPASKLVSGKVDLGNAPHRNVSAAGKIIILGRDEGCDQVLDDPRVSRRHARLVPAACSATIEDLGSTNGTFVNGERIGRPTTLKTGDEIVIGSFTFRLTADGNLEQRDYRGNVKIESRVVSVAVRERKLLEEISLTVLPSEFVGLMGPSGAGKTTFMNVLNGYTPPSSGSVLFNGCDLYANYQQFQGAVGYVPQDDIMHGELTVGQALYYSARLRLPRDFTNAEIHKRIAGVIHQLGLDGTENVLIGTAAKKGISGGQRKRVNLAMELLTDPSVLFLDEPTSGLSSEDALMVMRLLRELADDGKTILLTVHQPSLEAYRLLDNLVLVGKDTGTADPGRLVYYGPAHPHAIHFFNPGKAGNELAVLEASPDSVLRGLGQRKAADWAADYARSSLKQQFVDLRADPRGSTAAPVATSVATRPPALLQCWTLMRRSLAIKLRDLTNTAILMVQAPIIALLIVLVFGKQATAEVLPTTWQSVSKATSTTVFLLAVAAIWFGCSNAAREIVGEWPIYRRERMVSLRIGAYLAAKLLVLGTLCLVQCAVLLGIVWWGAGLKGSLPTLFMLLTLTALVGTGIGLATSALARTSEVAIALLPLILLPMIILAGVLQPLHEMNRVVRGVAQLMPSRWAFQGLLLTEAAKRPVWSPPQQPLPPSPRAAVGDADGVSAADQASASADAAPADRAREIDVAEAFFPERSRRAGAVASFATLLTMLGLLVATTAIILRRRDIH
ncbi:MAG TPA: FHA domain-containing protein [Pirellulales bacterium]|jgi:ABC-type multidrug transport system ATPase subunit